MLDVTDDIRARGLPTLSAFRSGRGTRPHAARGRCARRRFGDGESYGDERRSVARIGEFHRRPVDREQVHLRHAAQRPPRRRTARDVRQCRVCDR